MSMKERKYKDYFDIDPSYHPAVTADLIEDGTVSWKNFFPHETFIRLLESTHDVLSGKKTASLWIEGAYGTGKSHAALTIKSILDASDDEVREYFIKYSLKQDLCNKIIADKNDGLLITIHRIGSSYIRSDQDLILAIQESVSDALEKHGIQNKGEVSLRDAALKWLDNKNNREYFNSLIHEEQYNWDFGGENVEKIIEKLQNGPHAQIEETMKKVLKVANDHGILALHFDVQSMAKWIKSIISENNIKAIFFVWDEFTEYLQNNANSLTGFQTLVEISLSKPFYFLIVSHESRSLFLENETTKKIFDRFIPPIKIELPENMAFQLMHNAMKITKDELLQSEWKSVHTTLFKDIVEPCNYISNTLKKGHSSGSYAQLTPDDLSSILPIHPYAALILKHLSVVFSSNQRSMFDFIINDDMSDAKGFKWFISNYGPYDKSFNPYLSVDMLWPYFCEKGKHGLNEDVSRILDSYNLISTDNLIEDERKVIKVILLLHAISYRVSDVELLKPTDKNINLAFSGFWNTGKALSIANALVEKGILFSRLLANGQKEYTIANSTGDISTIKKLKQEILSSINAKQVIDDSGILDAVQLSPSINGRYIIRSATFGSFKNDLNKLESSIKPNRFMLLICFAMKESEINEIKNLILLNVNTHNKVIFVDASKNAMGATLLDQYVESLAYSKYYSQTDKHRANEYEKQAKKHLDDWKQKIQNGSFELYDESNLSGKHLATLADLNNELLQINYSKYQYGLEKYNVKNDLFNMTFLALAAECGITETLKQGMKDIRLEKELSGVWKVETKYWEDPLKFGLPIVKIKNKVEEVINKGFSSSSGRVSFSEIFSELCEPPYGFRVNNLAAFVLGFVLKEYANSDYFWSNGLASEKMSVDKMKTAISNAMKQTVTPAKNYKEEYIVEMSPAHKAFLSCTAQVFSISSSQCGSIESARDQIRICMRRNSFPIWTIKYILENVQLKCSTDEIKTAIDEYCGIANTANSKAANESDLATSIGNRVLSNQALVDDLTSVIKDENCRKGMLAYIEQYREGILKKLASEIGDDGLYIELIQQKFNSDAANWVWSTDTANEKIDSVILDYQIIVTSNKYIPGSKSISDVITAWNMKINHIKLPYDGVKKYVGDLSGLLGELLKIKQQNTIGDPQKQHFYNYLISQKSSFEEFYNNQLAYFKLVSNSFVEDLDEEEIEVVFNKIPDGQFTMQITPYLTLVNKLIDEYKENQEQKKLKDLWSEKTDSKSPREWSLKHNTPILCMFEENQRAQAKEMLDIVMETNPKTSSIERAIEFITHFNRWDDFKNHSVIDHNFMSSVVGDYSYMIDDIQSIRNSIEEHVTCEPYEWLNNESVKKRVKIIAERKYKTGGNQKVIEIIQSMDSEELRNYMKDLISDNVNIGIEILKNTKK